ncbi:MAG TPA: hypothetical protein VII11_01355 [Bacteroidota bacterium]
MGQTMITGAFFLLLITSVISANRMIGESNATTYEGDAVNLAVDVARSVLAETYRKKFDANYIDSVYQAASAFTSPNALGPATSEVFTPSPDVAPFQSFARYDDVDDYNGYQRTVDAAGVKGFKVSVSVYYVNPDTFAKSTTQTYLKRVEVSIEHATYMKTKMTFSSLVSL